MGYLSGLQLMLGRLLAFGPWDGGDDRRGGSPKSPFENFRNPLGNIGGSSLKRLALLCLVVISCLWVISGLYIVQPDEEAVELRFGRYSATKFSGLNYHLPYPIEEAIKVRVTNIQRMEIGYRTGQDRAGKYVTDVRGLEQESLLLTKDENIVDANFEIQWKIKNVRDYLFNFRGGEINATVRNAAESAVREVIGGQDIATLLEGAGRALLADDLQALLQSLFDRYGMGIHVVSIQFKKVDPPAAVIDAFLDVQSARADKERAVNVAYAYANDVIPRARGEAAVMMNNAMAYREELINGAVGESKRFAMVYDQYKGAKSITREKMRLDMLDTVLRGMNKIIVDKSNNSVYYLPLSDILKDHKENSVQKR